MKAWPVLRGARMAVVFLTRIPASGFPYTSEEARWASAWFPAVGGTIGLALGLVWWLAQPLEPLPAAFLTFTAALLVTGALHEDGLADTADALGGGADREAILRILKDSRIGSYGAAAMIVSLALRAALLASMPDRAMVALLVSQSVSRLPAVWLLARLPYVTPAGHSKSGSIARASGTQVGMATISVLGVALLLILVRRLSWARAVGTIGTAVAVVTGCEIWYRRRLGGVTGDLLGASQQVAEVGVLMVLAAHAVG